MIGKWCCRPICSGKSTARFSANWLNWLKLTSGRRRSGSGKRGKKNALAAASRDLFDTHPAGLRGISPELRPAAFGEAGISFEREEFSTRADVDGAIASDCHRGVGRELQSGGHGT